MTNFFQAFSETMAAAAFAQAGEHDFAREYLEAVRNSRKKVVLGVGAEGLTPTALRHVLELCKRVGAALEVLHAPTPKAARQKLDRKNDKIQYSPLPKQTSDELKKLDISERCAEKGVPLMEALKRYLADRKDIAFIVVSVGLEKEASVLAAKMGCPVVFHAK